MCSIRDTIKITNLRIFPPPGIRLARSGQASLSLSLGRELRGHDEASRAGDRRSTAGAQRTRGIPSGDSTLYYRLLPRQETRGVAVHGGTAAHNNTHKQPRLQLQARVHSAWYRVRKHDSFKTAKL